MNNDTSNLVNDLLSILQPDASEKPEKKPKAPKVEKTAVEKKEVKETVTAKPLSKKAEENTFLAGVEENTMKSTDSAKVVIRKDLYEVFMSIKRAKQIKSVSTLLDHALEDYIKRNSQNIKQLLTESSKNNFFD